MLQAGPLNQRVQIQRRDPAATQNAVGENVSPWVLLATVWASAEPLRGDEYLAAGQQQQVADVRFRIRWRPDVTPAMRVVWRGVAHDIVAAMDPLGRREALELMTLAGTRDARG